MNTWYICPRCVPSWESSFLESMKPAKLSVEHRETYTLSHVHTSPIREWYASSRASLVFSNGCTISQFPVVMVMWKKGRMCLRRKLFGETHPFRTTLLGPRRPPRATSAGSPAKLPLWKHSSTLSMLHREHVRDDGHSTGHCRVTYMAPVST